MAYLGDLLPWTAVHAAALLITGALVGLWIGNARKTRAAAIAAATTTNMTASDKTYDANSILEKQPFVEEEEEDDHEDDEDDEDDQKHGLISQDGEGKRQQQHDTHTVPETYSFSFPSVAQHQQQQQHHREPMSPAMQDYLLQLQLRDDAIRKRNAMAAAAAATEQHQHGSISPAMQDYHLQLLLRDHAIKKRNLMAAAQADRQQQQQKQKKKEDEDEDEEKKEEVDEEKSPFCLPAAGTPVSSLPVRGRPPVVDCDSSIPSSAPVSMAPPAEDPSFVNRFNGSNICRKGVIPSTYGYPLSSATAPVPAPVPASVFGPGASPHALQDYQEQLRLLSLQNKKRLERKAEEQHPEPPRNGGSPYAPVHYHAQLMISEQQRNLNLMAAAAEQWRQQQQQQQQQQKEQKEEREEEKKKPEALYYNSHPLQDYQYQLQLLEMQNKKRLMMAKQEGESRDETKPQDSTLTSPSPGDGSS